MNDEAFLFFIGVIIGMALATTLCVLVMQPWRPASDMECNPGYHAVQTSNELHHRWYGCQPITP